MILCDTGPLIALTIENDSHHERCTATLAQLPSDSLVTTWPCLAETMHMVGKLAGLKGQEAVWTMLREGLLRLHQPSATCCQRFPELMREYADAPMDLADASLVLAAEELGLRLVFTLDQHFHAYRIANGEAFQVVP